METQKLTSSNYTDELPTEENRNFNDKYSPTGESEFSRQTTHPLDEVLSERHINLGGMNPINRDHFSDEARYPNHHGKGPKGFKRSDERIREDVCQALFESPEVDASDIEVDVREGHVYLKGVVESREAKTRAEFLAERVYGIFDVHNELKIHKHGHPLMGAPSSLA